MQETRRYKMMPEFVYKGVMVSALLYQKGNTDLIHSWDIVSRGRNYSKSEADRAAVGFDEGDMATLNARVQSYVNHLEGRI